MGSREWQRAGRALGTKRRDIGGRCDDSSNQRRQQQQQTQNNNDEMQTKNNNRQASNKQARLEQGSQQEGSAAVVWCALTATSAVSAVRHGAHGLTRHREWQSGD